MKILVVEDSPTMRNLAIKALSALGYTDVLEAADGNAALTVLRTENIDLVLTDWNMPKMSGMELTKVIRNDPKLKSTPIIVTTARGMKNDIIEAAKAKINGYIVKPYTTAMLKAKLDKVLEANKIFEIDLKLYVKVGQSFINPKLNYLLKNENVAVDNGNVDIKLNHESISEPINIYGIKPGSSVLNIQINLEDKDGNPIKG